MTACAFGDPACPCQDGDPCHYVDLPGSPAMIQGPERPTAGPSAPEFAGVASVDPSPASGPLEGTVALVGEDSPFFTRVWRGSAVYSCPTCGSPHTSHAGVERHIGIVHPEPPAPTVEERAERSGIILATR